MTLVVGIDPSASKIAIVSTHEVLRTVSATTINLYAKGETRQSPASLRRALDGMGTFLQWADQIAPPGTRRLAWVESPLVGRGGVAATIKQAYVGGIIRAMLELGDFEVHDVNVSTWKKQVCGNGASQKPAVKQTVKQLWPKGYESVRHDLDLIDAAAINRYGVGIVAREQAITNLAAGPAGWAV